MAKRFTYSRSPIYGWCVYDKERGNMPAYDACCELLPPLKVDETGTTYESPVLLSGEWEAMKLCSKLNRRVANNVKI